MSELVATRTVTVANRAGIHARAATMIAAAVRGFRARVTVVKGNERVEGTDVLQILSLGSALGEQLSLEASGEEAEAALEALETMFVNKFGED
jgi:phosphotransferase system HPr (HPr) family protein